MVHFIYAQVFQSHSRRYSLVSTKNILPRIAWSQKRCSKIPWLNLTSRLKLCLPLRLIELIKRVLYTLQSTSDESQSCSPIIEIMMLRLHNFWVPAASHLFDDLNNILIFKQMLLLPNQYNTHASWLTQGIFINSNKLITSKWKKWHAESR